MSHLTLITLFDYMSVLTSPRDIHPSRGCDAPVTGGCERCHTAITPHDAYFARFGTLRCRDCIGNDGFAAVADLELFRQTGTLPCPGCGQPIQLAEVAPDGTSCIYHCTCGTTARYTIPAAG